jgi:spore coat polysaccharide biosynthesis predicted glycosyltransferase SpsG
MIADGGHEMGMGHIMRCLSLAKVLRNEKIDVIFYCGGDVACKKIESEEFKVIPLNSPFNPALILPLNKGRKREGLFIDLPPHINRSCYIDSARKRGIVSIAFDDMLINGEKADVIINPSLKSPLSPFSKGGIEGIYYSGAEYMVLNDSFCGLRCHTKNIKVKAKNILITMGGSDPDGQTERILNALLNLNLNLNLEVVIGIAYKDLRFTNYELRFKIHHDVSNMAELMMKVDMAFVAGGITLYEAASVGLPVIVIAQDKYQALTAGEFQKKGFGIYLGMFNEVSEDLIQKECIELLDDYNMRKAMGDIGKKLVYGKGVFRVAEIIKTSFSHR